LCENYKDQDVFSETAGKNAGHGEISSSAAEQFSEKRRKPLPEGLKPSESQAFIAGAKATMP
jgi:hypothetical protein